MFIELFVVVFRKLFYEPTNEQISDHRRAVESEPILRTRGFYSEVWVDFKAATISRLIK